MMARMARIMIDSTGRRVVEGTAGQGLVGEVERKHDGEDGEDKRQYKDLEKGGQGNGSAVMAAGGAFREA